MSINMLVEAFLRSPAAPRLIDDGCKTAVREKRFDDANTYRLIGDQLANVPR